MEKTSRDRQNYTNWQLKKVQGGEREREREESAEQLVDSKMIRNVQILISSTGADLTALLNLGYNLAERDISCKTPRDVAVESGVQDNINAIGKFSSPLLPISEQI